MNLLIILGLLYVSRAEEQLEEQHPQCNCSRVLTVEETTTEVSPTFPTTSFTCWGRYDGYYADIEVDCTIFHYCQTWQFPSGLNETVKWDFACPQSTIFNQKILSCTPPNISFDCQESPNYYWVNINFTLSSTTTPAAEDSTSNYPTTPVNPNLGQQLIVGLEPHSQEISPEPSPELPSDENPINEFDTGAVNPAVEIPTTNPNFEQHVVPALELQPPHPVSPSEPVTNFDSSSDQQPPKEFETDSISFPGLSSSG